jgi:hypothetical protein
MVSRHTLAVWTEKESGDWEACVAASYLMGLVYGGVTAFPLGVYTQAEREALELIPDEPQDYATTDAQAQARYGVHLRKLSTGSIADAVTRTGVGLVCTGYGGFLIPTNASIHSLFYLPTSPTAGLVYDPLANSQSAGVPVTAAQVVTWTAGRAGPNQVREVRDSEFLPPPEEESMYLKGSNPRPMPPGARTTTTEGNYLIADPTVTPYRALMEIAAGSVIDIDWQVTATEENGVDQWYGAWVGSPVAPPQFGYLSLRICGPVELPAPPAGGDEAWRAWYAARPISPLEIWLEEAPE